MEQRRSDGAQTRPRMQLLRGTAAEGRVGEIVERIHSAGESVVRALFRDTTPPRPAAVLRRHVSPALSSERTHGLSAIGLLVSLDRCVARPRTFLPICVINVVGSVTSTAVQQ